MEGNAGGEGDTRGERVRERGPSNGELCHCEMCITILLWWRRVYSLGAGGDSWRGEGKGGGFTGGGKVGKMEMEQGRGEEKAEGGKRERVTRDGDGGSGTWYAKGAREGNGGGNWDEWERTLDTQRQTLSFVE